MKMQLCARCKKRPAMVFITRLENEKSVNEGICLLCAKELGIKPVNDMLRSMGISDEEISGMSDSIEGMMESINDNLPDDVAAQDLTDGKLPTMNLGEILGFTQKKSDEAPRGKGTPKAGQTPTHSSRNQRCDVAKPQKHRNPLAKEVCLFRSAIAGRPDGKASFARCEF